MSKRKTPPVGKASWKSIRHVLNTVKDAMRREKDTNKLLKLGAYRDKLLTELAEVENAEQKKKEAEKIKAELAAREAKEPASTSSFTK